jgi:hypothetical protein
VGLFASMCGERSRAAIETPEPAPTVKAGFESNRL